MIFVGAALRGRPLDPQVSVKVLSGSLVTNGAATECRPYKYLDGSIDSHVVQ